MHKCMAKDALRNAPCLYKVWTYVFWCKVQGPIYLRNSFFCGTHTQMGQRAFGWFHGSLKLVRAVHQHVDCQLRIREPPFPPPLTFKRARSAKGGKKKENKPSSFTSRTQTPSSQVLTALSLSERPHSFLCRNSFPAENYALPSLYVFLSLSQFFSRCAFLPYLLDGHPKEKKTKTDEIISVAFLELPECTFWMIQLLRTERMKTPAKYFLAKFVDENLQLEAVTGVSYK